MKKIMAFFKSLAEMTSVYKRNNCPHCGGVHCIGACGVTKKESKKMSFTAKVTLLSRHEAFLEGFHGEKVTFAPCSDLGKKIIEVSKNNKICKYTIITRENTLTHIFSIKPVKGDTAQTL